MPVAVQWGDVSDQNYSVLICLIETRLATPILQADEAVAPPLQLQRLASAERAQRQELYA